MDGQSSGFRKFLSTRAGKWILGAAILFGFALLGGLFNSNEKTNSDLNTNQTVVQNQNTKTETVKTITIPSLVEYDDDKTVDDVITDIKQENVAIPPNYTVVSSDNSNIANPVGSRAEISSVIDGDTVKLSDGNKVRILGIDTPETVDPRKAVQCFGREASDKMKELVSGKKVILLVDAEQGDKDKYGRLLRYIYLDNDDIGARMISEGYAFAYTKYPVGKTDEYKTLEQQARDGKKGLWAEDTCNGSTVIPEPTATQTNTNSSAATNSTPAPTLTYTCNCSKTCPNMSSCAEAQYQLNTCGCSARDTDKDGIACDTDCQ